MKKVNLFQAIFTHNLWLKIISFIVAVVVWLYVSNEILKGVRF